MVQAYDLNWKLLMPENKRVKIIDCTNRIQEELSAIEKENYRLFNIIVKLQAELKAKDEAIKRLKKGIKSGMQQINLSCARQHIQYLSKP
jgi:2C-methyl-D-erythritol 2,4-cyclodiphosphate synthase